MRPWRKLHSSILESERFMDIPLEAKVLFFLLVAAQDDTGYYPWERIKVRRLVATCSWSEAQAKKHANALVSGGMATWEDGGIVLRKGQELNGRLRGDREPVIYQRSTTDIPLTDSGKPQAAPLDLDTVVDQRLTSGLPLVNPEGEERRGESKSKSKSKEPSPNGEGKKVDEPFILKMVALYATCWSESAVRERIAEALNHKASDKRKNKQLYVETWLRRDAERLIGGAPNARPYTEQSQNPDDYAWK